MSENDFYERRQLSQRRAFLGWVNYHLQQSAPKGSAQKVTNFQSDWVDGSVFIALAEDLLNTKFNVAQLKKGKSANRMVTINAISPALHGLSDKVCLIVSFGVVLHNRFD